MDRLDLILRPGDGVRELQPPALKLLSDACRGELLALLAGNPTATSLLEVTTQGMRVRFVRNHQRIAQTSGYHTEFWIGTYQPVATHEHLPQRT